MLFTIWYASNKDFFMKVWEIVEDRINYLKRESPFSGIHDKIVFRAERLKSFQEHLHAIDRWNNRPAHIVLNE
jgi:hypothetical protein